MSQHLSRNTVGFGAGALDVYLPVGVTGPDHEPGAKVGWTAAEDQLLLQTELTEHERHIGGNVMNVLAYLACQDTRQVSFVSTLGINDAASTAIRAHLPRVGITDLTITAEGYLPSISIVERAEPGSDRMVRGRPRGEMSRYISDEHIATALKGANVVVAASLKDVTLAKRIFDSTPENYTTFLAYNPGSSEFTKHPEALRALMQERPPDLLALNETELQQLFDSPHDDSFELSLRANRIADYVLCTLGKAGILLAHNGDIVYHPAPSVDPTKVVDTLGAGDRAHAVAIDGLLRHQDPHQILEEAANSTAQVIQCVGAHGDLYKRSLVAA